MILVHCPHCQQLIEIVELNCRIFRCGVLKQTGEQHGWKTFIPPFEYCTDNAAMIAITAYHKYLAGIFSSLDAVPFARAEW